MKCTAYNSDGKTINYITEYNPQTGNKSSVPHTNLTVKQSTTSPSTSTIPKQGRKSSVPHTILTVKQSTTSTSTTPKQVR
nr:DUF2963 domain-containing protein [Mulberry dwarf phytoplasma]